MNVPIPIAELLVWVGPGDQKNWRGDLAEQDLSLQGCSEQAENSEWQPERALRQSAGGAANISKTLFADQPNTTLGF